MAFVSRIAHSVAEWLQGAFYICVYARVLIIKWVVLGTIMGLTGYLITKAV